MELQLSEIIFTLVNFLILVFILYKLLYGPLTRAMDSRRQAIKDTLDAADEARKEAELTKAGLHQEIVNARAEADDLLSVAKKSGEIMRGELLAKAEEEAKNIIEKAKKEINYEKEAAVLEIRKEVATLAVDIAAKILREQIDPETQKKLADKYIKEVGQIQ